MEQPTHPRPDHPFIVLGGDDIAAMTRPEELIALAAEALRSTSDLSAVQDVRRVLDLREPGGPCLSVMYAAIAGLPLFGAKVLSVFPSNFDHGLPSHRGGILLFESTRGQPVALVDGGQTTAWRTAAASAAATRVLAREDASVLTLMGYGEQAARHVTTLAAVRPIREIRVWGRNADKAAAFAERQRAEGFDARPVMEAAEAVADADIVCTVTSAREPVLNGDWLSPGTHVNAVGASVPSCRELDDACIARAQIFVDYMPMAVTAAGEIAGALAAGWLDRAALTEIGSVLAGGVPGRSGPEVITIYRSLGVPAQDIAFAIHFHSEAIATGRGTAANLEGRDHA